MMDRTQVGILAGLMALFLVRGPSLAAYVLAGNMVATLSLCAAMDLQAIDRDGATLSMMLVDAVSGAVLISHAGMPRVLAAIYAAMVLVYSLNILFGVQISTTFAIVNVCTFIQLAVAGIGGTDNGAGNRRRFGNVGAAVFLSRRNTRLDQAAMGPRATMVSTDSGGLNGP